MTVRKSSKILMVLGLSGYLYSFGNLILTPEPKKPIELNKPGIEELVEKERYQEIKRDYAQQEDQFAGKMLYSAIFGIFSIISLGIGLKRDKKEIIDYLKKRSEEYNQEKYE